MLENDHHLEQCFWITKPQQQTLNFSIQKEDEDKHASKDEQVEEFQGRRKKTLCRENVSLQNLNQFNKIYQMITHKRPPSAQISTKLLSKKQNQAQQSRGNFLNQFQQFFQGFVSEKGQQVPRSSRKKKNTHIFHNSTKTTVTQPTERKIKEQEQKNEDEEQEILIRQIDRKMTYHRRKKHKIQAKIDGLVNKKEQRKLRKVEMIDKQKDPPVENVLKMKQKCKKQAPRMRMIRSGLPIQFNQVDLRERNRNNALLEDHKAKIDKNFFKSLQKNCQVVLCQISNFSQDKNEKQNSKYIPQHLSRQQSYMKQTKSQHMKSKPQAIRKSMDDGNFQRWKNQVKTIDKKYRKNKKNSRQLSGGLKVFEGYCQFIDNKWAQDQDRLKEIISLNNSFSKEHPYSNFQ